MCGDLWINKFAAQGFEAFERAFLVGPDQPRIARHIGGEDRSKTADGGHSSGKPARRRPAYSVGSASLM
jgi:hypothetical protein